MATLTELNSLVGTPPPTLQAQIVGALLIAAQGIVANGSATAPQRVWAARCLQDPTQFRAQALNAVYASNNTATVAVISSATDAQVQTAVNAVLPILTG